MNKRIAVVGAGALGGYVGGALAHLGHDVTLIDAWPEHVETIASVVGWGRVLGVVASLISVDMYEAGRIRRTVAKGGEKHTVFRVGEPHGRVTPRAEELASWLRGLDSSKVTTNLWGERWS